MTARLAASRRNTFLLAACIAAVTLVAHAQSVRFGFVSLDDRTYVTSNPYVLAGITAGGLKWAWATTYAANWHPLTWLSLMLDAEIGGGAAWPFHFTNLLLHTANAVLLFAVLKRTTLRAARSAFVAALFGVHPLHVESVAWVVERKDVLSTFFWLLLLLVYARNAESPSRRRMGIVAACLAASLLAKPMMVTAPLLLLLLDYWPLDRLTRGTTWTGLLGEKWPLAVLSIVSCIVTLAAQSKGGAVRGIEAFPLGVRAANAAISYVAYLVSAVWPSGLAVYYPHPGQGVSVVSAIACAAFLVAITAVGFGARRSRPYLMVGWLWYLVTLLPVIGIVQVGLQGRADRYTYVPLAGIFVLVAWGVSDLARIAFGANSPAGRGALTVTATLTVVVLAIAARTQTRLWKSEVALYEHALRVTRNNDLAQAALGSALAVRGEMNAARAHLDEALRLNPKNVEARHELAVLSLREGRTENAVALFRSVLGDAPSFHEARAGLAAALLAQGDVTDADRESASALSEAPWLASAHAARGAVRLAQQRLSEAEASFREAVRLDAENPEYEVGLGNAYVGTGKSDQAIAAYRAAIRLRPETFQAHLPLGALLFQSGHAEEGLAHLEEAVRLHSESAEARLNLGVALFKIGRATEAVAQFKRVLEVDPENQRARSYLRLANTGNASHR